MNLHQALFSDKPKYLFLDFNRGKKLKPNCLQDKGTPIRSKLN